MVDLITDIRWPASRVAGVVAAVVGDLAERAARGEAPPDFVAVVAKERLPGAAALAAIVARAAAFLGGGNGGSPGGSGEQITVRFPSSCDRRSRSFEWFA